MKTFSKQWQWMRRMGRIAFKDTLIGQSVVVLLVCIAIAALWGGLGKWPLHTDLLVEFWGLIFDVSVILVGFGIIQYFRQKQDEIARHEEVIEDLKGWSSDEAKHRVLGAMRRLNRLGKTDFELSGAHIKNANFTGYGVTSIRGSKLSSGGDWVSDEFTTSNFESVDFSNLDVREVVFEKTAPLAIRAHKTNVFGSRATYKNCEFRGSDLSDATFDGAKLTWSDQPPESLEELVGIDSDQLPIYVTVARGSFDQVDLSRTSFRFCNFERADFRNAVNIEEADFYGAEGLDTCVFDSDELKESIIQNSKLNSDD